VGHCNTCSSVHIAFSSRGRCDGPLNLPVKTQELVALKEVAGLFPCFKYDIVLIYLNSGVIFIMFFDGINEIIPIVFIDDSFGQTRKR
jgi:hypothetical protein